MSFASGAVAYLSLAGVDLTPWITDVKLPRKGKEERHHLLGSRGVVTLTHDYEATIEVDGLIDPEPRSLFTSNQGAGKPTIEAIYGPQGNTSGAPKSVCQVVVVDYDDDTSGEKTGMFKATLGVSGLIDDSGTF